MTTKETKQWNLNRVGKRGDGSKPITCKCGVKTKFHAKSPYGAGNLCKDCYIDHLVGFNKIASKAE